MWRFRYLWFRLTRGVNKISQRKFYPMHSYNILEYMGSSVCPNWSGYDAYYRPTDGEYFIVGTRYDPGIVRSINCISDSAGFHDWFNKVFRTKHRYELNMKLDMD